MRPEVPRRAEGAVHTSLSGTQFIVLTDGLDQSIDAANACLQHLEIQVRCRQAHKNAVPSFRRSCTPVPLGDRVRLQPRAAHRRHRPLAAGLGVHTFMKPVEVIEYDEKASGPSPPVSTPSRYPGPARPRRVRALPLRQDP